jgi:F420-dependent oxidoreductase-like protein
MRLGVHLINFDYPGGPTEIGSMLTRFGAAAEAAGIANLSVMDHYFQLDGIGPVDAPMLEAHTTLGYLAGVTSTVQLQVLVTGVTYRYPGLLAKTISTLDVLSGGRAALGLGAAWYEREHHALGVPYPGVSERLDRLEETLQIVRQMWSADNGPYVGRYYRLAETINAPQPLQNRPPIMIGGSGEKRLLRLVAKYADATNMFAGSQITADAVAAKYEVLAAHCAREGTDFAGIAKTVLWVAPVIPGAEGGAAFVEQLRPFAEIGVEQVHVMPFLADPTEFVAGLGEHVVAGLAELG